MPLKYIFKSPIFKTTLKTFIGFSCIRLRKIPFLLLGLGILVSPHSPPSFLFFFPTPPPSLSFLSLCISTWYSVLIIHFSIEEHSGLCFLCNSDPWLPIFNTYRILP